MDDGPRIHQPGDDTGPPEGPTRRDVVRIGRDIRQDWGLSDEGRAELLDRLFEATESWDPRVAGAAMRSIAAFMRLQLRQAAQDLAREKHEGKRSEAPWADKVKAAEERYEKNKRERGHRE